MTLLALLGQALAIAPDRVVLREEVGTEVRDLALSDDGRWLGAVASGGNALHVRDTWTWRDTTLAACAGVRGLAVATTEGGGAVFYAGCGDGSVVVVDARASGAVELGASALDVADQAILGLETDGATLWAVVGGVGGANPKVLAWDLAAGGPLATSSALATASVNDTARSGSLLFVLHGGDDISKVDTRTLSAVQPQENLGSRDFVDAWAYTSGTVYLADENGSLCVFNAGGNDLSILRDDLATTVTAVGGDAEAGWMLVGTGDDAQVFGFSGTPGSEVGSITGAGGLREVLGSGAWAYGGTSDGALLVLSGAPWITLEPLASGTFDTGDTVPLSFSSDRAGRYEVRVGGTLDAPGGEVARGTLEADESISMDLAVSESFVEGTNLAWVFVEDADGVGHAAAPIVVDRAPVAPALGPSNVGFGDGRVRVRFAGLEAEDLASYAIYLSDTPFTEGDWPEGGPNPRTIQATPGEDVDTWLEGLTNGVTYHVAVRAFDAGGRVSRMSDVVSVTPEETYALAEQLGVGTRCGTPGAAQLGLAALAAGLAALRGRRGARRALLGGGGLCLLALLGHATEAWAEPLGALELAGGPAHLEAPLLEAAFGESTAVEGRLGAQLGGRRALLGVSLGAAPLSGYQVSASGARSAEEDSFLILPASVEGVLRLDVMGEGRQPLVPYARAGVDAWGWTERWSEDGESERAIGLATGWHGAGGVLLRLDALDPASASSLEVDAGIRDSWLAVEWRRNRVAQGALDLSGDTWSVGLTLDR